MTIGILLAVVSGILLGICFTPMRCLKTFAWENTWFAWNLWACIIISPLIALITIPSIFEVFTEIGLRRNLAVLAIGMLSGASAILFGLGLARVGTTLVNVLCNGIAMIVGSFIPLIVQHREVLTGQIGALLTAGFALSLAGVIVSAWAGSVREQPSAYMAHNHRSSRRIALEGILLCVAAGLLMPLVNLGLAFGDGMMHIARDHGASEVFMSFAIYVPFFATTFVSTAFYSASRWKWNQTYHEFFGAGSLRLVLITALIAVLWISGNVIYGAALPWMESYGPVLGWPICLASCNITAALVECAYGDWKGKSLVILAGGLFILTASIGMFGYVSMLIQKLATAEQLALN